MMLVHFSSRPIECVYDCEPHKDDPLWKPNGLWLSVEGNGDGWSDWCHAESFRDCHKQIAYRIELASSANILRLGSPSEIINLGNRYRSQLNHRLSDYRVVDWPSVMAEYDGIIITPYQWECRLNRECNWYYTWDCASGCIWKARAVASLTEIEAAQFAPKEQVDA